MKIATLNINSINARLPLLLSWLKTNTPDVLLLQEIKSTYENFPFFELNAAGYQVKIVGQKGYNGVAVLSQSNIHIRRDNLPNFNISEARYLETEINGMIISSIYMPNGNPVGSPNYEKKLAFMDAFYQHASNLKYENDKIIFECAKLAKKHSIAKNSSKVGIIYTKASLFEKDALFQKEVQDKLKALEYIGYVDAYRTLHPKDFGYTYWDYGPSAFANDFGLRIDYFLCSPAVIEHIQNCAPDRTLRSKEKPSDHTVLVANFNL